uniref:RAP domain-containing protein n=1 Tax=Timema monikensis TaxID=170555 RepID=A0A7R9HT61_9NEOP|nr:unnamed protein product [Timema monikensis]
MNSKQKKQRLQADVDTLTKSAVKLSEQAETTGNITFVSKSLTVSEEQQEKKLPHWLTSTSSSLIETIDHLVGYTIEQSEHLLGDTVEKLLHLCYYLGYTPSHSDEFFVASVNAILRDKERMQGLSLLHSALALCFFHKLPEPLVQFIFTVDFLERMDDEISQCYSKATYPMKIRHHLMQLNRAVCLDYPDIDVPWFHEKYIQEIDAHNFQVLLNTDKKPLWEKHETDKNVSKLAVVLLQDNDYCLNIPQLKGECQLKQRHLEMLGYQVVGIKQALWNSMYMSEPKAKLAYLEKLLWPN